MGIAVQNKSELFERLHQHSTNIRKFGVQRLGIFGSFSRDSASKSSDVDFFGEVGTRPKNVDPFMDLAIYLQDITGRKIELVTRQSLNKFIGKYILEEVEYVSLAA